MKKWHHIITGGDSRPEDKAHPGWPSDGGIK